MRNISKNLLFGLFMVYYACNTSQKPAPISSIIVPPNWCNLDSIFAKTPVLDFEEAIAKLGLNPVLTGKQLDTVTLASFVPMEYNLTDHTVNDFNEDGKEDLAIVVQHKRTKLYKLFLWQGGLWKKWSLWLETEQAILQGNKADFSLFQGIIADKGLLTICYFSGYRYQITQRTIVKYNSLENDFFLEKQLFSVYDDNKGKVEMEIRTQSDFGKWRLRDFNAEIHTFPCSSLLVNKELVGNYFYQKSK